MSKQALLGAILASSASLGLAVSGKCAGNDATATDLDSQVGDKFQFDCTAGYQLKATATDIDFAGSDAAAKTATCCDEVSGKCGENKATATDLAELSSAMMYQFACGAGYTLRANPVAITLAGNDAAAKKATCCEALSGKCGGNAVTATGFAEASTPTGTFQFACGDEFLKPNSAALVPGSGTDAEKKAACCEIPKCSSRSINADFCGTGKELDTTKSSSNCDATECNSDASRTLCCKTSAATSTPATSTPATSGSVAATGAACSTIATTEGFCGTQMYDSSKATSKCAGDPCSKTTGSDTAACCKTDPRALCGSIYDKDNGNGKEGFCGALIFDPYKSMSKCAGDACDKSKASDTGACCTVDPIPVCAKTDGSVMPWAATNTGFVGAPCYCGDDKKVNMCGEGSACTPKDVAPCVCTPDATQICKTEVDPDSNVKSIEALKFGCFPMGSDGTQFLKIGCAAEGTNVLAEMYTDDKCTKVATGANKMTVVVTEKDVTETNVSEDGKTVTEVKTSESATSTCNGGSSAPVVANLTDTSLNSGITTTFSLATIAAASIAIAALL